MKKKSKYLIEKIADIDNLRYAFWKAQRGKSDKPDCIFFQHNLDKNLNILREQIKNGKINVGNYQYFYIFDPKKRLICAAEFSERVLHNAIMNICHTYFENYQIFDSYASRENKGTYAAIDRAMFFQNKYKWFAKLDIRKYFDSIDHTILKNQIKKIIKDKYVLNIFFQILDSYENTENKGLPIGNLTSQYWANHYLAISDHFIKNILLIPAYVRYMDDMILWEDNKDLLLEKTIKLENFLKEKLDLSLKHCIINKSHFGVPYLGYVVKNNNLKLKESSLKRFKCKLYMYNENLDNSLWNENEYQNHILPLISFICKAETLAIRKKIMKEKDSS